MHDIYTINKDDLPFLLKQIPDPPERLFIKGKLPDKDKKILCIVGARQYSSYGEDVCRKLISGLKDYDISIVSGLAIGIDTIAHKTAIDSGLQTIAFPGSGIRDDVLYPERNRKLADEILYCGGAIVSEFEPDQVSAPWTFPIRNRLMAGISHTTIVIEAGLVSGSLITSKLATEYNRDVGAVPGNIFSKLAAGPNMLISLGAKIIRGSNDILDLLDIKRKDITSSGQMELFPDLNEGERKIIDLLEIEPYSMDELIIKSELSTKEVISIISSLELNDFIEIQAGKFQLKIK